MHENAHVLVSLVFSHEIQIFEVSVNIKIYAGFDKFRKYDFSWVILIRLQSPDLI